MTKGKGFEMEFGLLDEDFLLEQFLINLALILAHLGDENGDPCHHT